MPGFLSDKEKPNFSIANLSLYEEILALEMILKAETPKKMGHSHRDEKNFIYCRHFFNFTWRRRFILIKNFYLEYLFLRMDLKFLTLELFAQAAHQVHLQPLPSVKGLPLSL